jgi:antitoxin component of RelBE/YafQ-DinJ toxin-antitoxin module
MEAGIRTRIICVLGTVAALEAGISVREIVEVLDLDGAATSKIPFDITEKSSNRVTISKMEKIATRRAEAWREVSLSCPQHLEIQKCSQQNTGNFHCRITLVIEADSRAKGQCLSLELPFFLYPCALRPQVQQSLPPFLERMANLSLYRDCSDA